MEPKSSKKVTVVGTSRIDHVLYVDHFPQEDQKCMIDTYMEQCGGNPINVGINLALLGIMVSLISWLGEDEFGLLMRRKAKRMGIIEDGLVINGEITPQAYVIVSRETRTHTVFMRKSICPFSLKHTQEKQIQGSTIVYYDGSLPELAPSIFELCRKKNISIFTNYELPSSHGLDALLSSNVAIASEQALNQEKVLDRDELEYKLTSLWRENHAYIGATFGSKGSTFFNGHKILSIPAIHVDEIDTTGAGDAFQAGLIFGWLNDWSLSLSIKFATSLGALKCRIPGSNFSAVEGLNIEEETFRILNHAKWISKNH